MKKFRLLTTLFSAVLSMGALSACTVPTEADIHAVLPAPSEIQKEGLNIESITFENVPDKIPVGSFDSFGMKLKIVYSDGSIEEYPLLFDNFPDNLKLVFNTVGKHTVTIAFRGQELTYTFNITEGQTFFLVRYYNYDGKIVQREQVDPSVGKVTAPAPNPDKVKRDSDPLYHYSFNGWSEDLPVGTIIGTDYNIYPTYQVTQRRYDVSKQVVPTFENGSLRLIQSNYTEYYKQGGAYVYAGRIDRVPLLYSESKDKETTTPPYSGELFYEFTNGEEQKAVATSVLEEIYDKAMDVDISDYNDIFMPGMNSDPINKVFDMNDLTIANPDYPILFEGDTSYSEMYHDAIYKFVGTHGSSNKTSFNINPASNMLEGNKYYRVAIEASVDVFIEALFYAQGEKYQFIDFSYHFLINSVNTYIVTEYTDSSNKYNSTGSILSYTMSDLDAVLRKVVEG